MQIDKQTERIILSQRLDAAPPMLPGKLFTPPSSLPTDWVPDGERVVLGERVALGHSASVSWVEPPRP